MISVSSKMSYQEVREKSGKMKVEKITTLSELRATYLHLASNIMQCLCRTDSILFSCIILQSTLLITWVYSDLEID